MGETDCILDLEAHRTLRPPGKEERTMAEKVTCIVRGETHRYSDCSRILLLLPMHCPPSDSPRSVRYQPVLSPQRVPSGIGSNALWVRHLKDRPSRGPTQTEALVRRSPSPQPQSCYLSSQSGQPEGNGCPPSGALVFSSILRKRISSAHALQQLNVLAGAATAAATRRQSALNPLLQECRNLPTSSHMNILVSH